jgi:cytochrome c oxidase cbb3-type subunit III
MSSGCSVLAVCAALLSAGCDGGVATPDVVEAQRVVEMPVGPLPGAAVDQLEGPANPFEHAAESLGEGRRYFVSYNCAGCHGDHGGGGMGPSLRDHTWIYGASHAHIANSIAQGRAYGMPAWRQKLTDAQIWQIAAYVKSMRTEREPEPPR